MFNVVIGVTRFGLFTITEVDAVFFDIIVLIVTNGVKGNC
jgi:hypothetical protein